GDKGELPDRRGDRPRMDELLHRFENCGAPLGVELGALLLEKLVQIRVAAIDISAALDRQGFEAGRRVAERAAAAHDQVLELLLGVSLEEGGAFERPQPGTDDDLPEV